MTSSPVPPRVGVQLPTREYAMAGGFAAAPLLAFARRAEEFGFDSLWTGDSVTARPRLEPLVVLSAAAAVTERITLGTAAYTAALRHPVHGAHQLATLDQVAAGRLAIGLGSGFPIPETADEFDTLGIPAHARAARLDETAALWRATWRHEKSFGGELWQIDGLDRLPKPATVGGPPLWLAASDAPGVLRRVAAHYDGWLPFLPDATAYCRAWQRIQQLAADHGRSPDAITPALYATLVVDDDPARARTTLERYVEGYYARSLEFMTSIQAYHAGTAADCAEWLAEYVHAGARHLVLRIGTLDPAAELEHTAEVRRILLDSVG